MPREIRFHKEHFMTFYQSQSSKVQQKIEFVLKMISTVDRVPVKFLKHLTGTDGLYEIRIDYSGDIYRVFCFFDEGDVIVLLQGFKKKTQKLSSQEIKKAHWLRAQYFEEKLNDEE